MCCSKGKGGRDCGEEREEEKGARRWAEELCVSGERLARELECIERSYGAPAALSDPPSTSSLLPTPTAFKGVQEHDKSC
jgi:hypothetical protein